MQYNRSLSLAQYKLNLILYCSSEMNVCIAICCLLCREMSSAHWPFISLREILAVSLTYCHFHEMTIVFYFFVIWLVLQAIRGALSCSF